MKRAFSLIIALIAIAVTHVKSTNVPGSGIPDNQPMLQESNSNSDNSLNNDEAVDRQRSFRFKAERSNVELFANSRQATRMKKGGVMGAVEGAAKGAVNKQVTKKAKSMGLIYRFYPEEKVYAQNEEKAKQMVVTMNDRNKKNLEKWKKENTVWLAEAKKSIGGYSWGDKQLCGSCHIVLNIAWHNVEQIEDPDEDDVYNAIADVCGEHISVAEEACKKIESDSATVTEKLLTSKEVQAVCVDIELCTLRTLSSYQ